MAEAVPLRAALSIERDYVVIDHTRSLVDNLLLESRSAQEWRVDEVQGQTSRITLLKGSSFEVHHPL